MKDTNYFNDSATKAHKDKARNPLENLTADGMRDLKRTALDESSKNYTRTSPPTEKSSNLEDNIIGTEDFHVKIQDPSSLFTSFAGTENQEQESKEDNEMISQIMKVEIFLIITKFDLVSDFEVSRSKKYCKDFLSKHPDSYEVHYGLSQVYFSLGLYYIALEEINIALAHEKNDIQYMTWKAIYLYYIFQTDKDKTKRIEALRKLEKLCKKILQTNNKSLFALYLLFTTMIDVIKLKAKGVVISSSSKKSPEAYAVRIKDLNNYLGELALADLNMTDPEKVINGRDGYISLIDKYTNIPHSYLKLCLLDCGNNHFSHSLDTIEKMYHSKEIKSIQELDNLIPLLYAEMLFKEKQYVRCFETLRNEF